MKLRKSVAALRVQPLLLAAGLGTAVAFSSLQIFAADPHAGHEHHMMPTISGDDPHAGHDMSAMQGKDPHAGHDMSGHADAHAGHDMAAQGENDPHAHHRAMLKQQAKSASIELEVPEGLAMLNQYGEQVDLRKDVIGDRIVVVDFIYTSCQTVCPVVSSIFSMVQDELGESMDKEVALITITVDPARDTSHRMLDYSKKFNPAEGWSWLTGDKKVVDKVNTLFGAYTPSFEDHPAMVLIGDTDKSEWYRFYGFPAPKDITAKVRELIDARAG